VVPEPAVLTIPGAYARLVPLLRAIIEDMADKAPNAPAMPHRFFDANWLGMRYAEVLPIPLAARQKLLEIEDGIDRLEIIYRFLEGKGLLPEG
jgi:Lon protease-like protein